ncbi:MAG TPA: hypothetical protein VL285_01605, partial [Bryobacteraceae bacterium]|nr:hypothetical protein [Bryobacteraceae bacterium]
MLREAGRRAGAQGLRARGARYAEQGEVVAAARGGLSRLGSGTEASKPASVAVRRVQFADGLTEIGGISPDGRYLSFVDGGHGHGDLSVMDLATGQKQQVAKGASHKANVKVGAELSVFSPDGKQLAYGWHGPPDNDQLRIINVDGTGERTLFKKDHPMWIQTHGWAGGHVLIMYGRRDSKETQILVVSAADGSVQTLKTLQGDQPQVKLSPDGSWVAVAVSHPGSSLENTLSLISTADGREVPLPKQAGLRQWVQGWTPDGKALLFTSTRDGRNNLYGLRVENGKAL